MRGLKRQRVCNDCYEYTAQRVTERQRIAQEDIDVRFVEGRRESATPIPMSPRVSRVVQLAQGHHQNAPEEKYYGPE